MKEDFKLKVKKFKLFLVFILKFHDKIRINLKTLISITELSSKQIKNLLNDSEICIVSSVTYFEKDGLIIFRRNLILGEDLTNQDLLTISNLLSYIVLNSTKDGNNFDRRKAKVAFDLISLIFDGASSLIVFKDLEFLKLSIRILILFGSLKKANFLLGLIDKKYISDFEEELFISNLRGGRPIDDLDSDLKLIDFLKVERSDSELCLKYCQENNFNHFFYFLICVPIFFLSYFRLLLNKRIVKKLNWAELRTFAHSELHWEQSCKILASYWYGPKFYLKTVYDFLFESLKSDNIYIQIRTMDWSNFVLSHYRPLFLNLFISRHIFGLSNKLTPLLSQDAKMHLSILLYYNLDFKSSMALHAELDSELAVGNHDFNKMINLANAMRSAVALGDSRLLNIIYYKSRNIKGFESSPLNIRSKLAFLISQKRLTDADVNWSSELESLTLIIESAGPLQKVTCLLLLAIAYGELGEAARKSDSLLRCKTLIDEMGIWAIYKKIFIQIEKGIFGRLQLKIVDHFISSFERLFEGGKDFRTLSIEELLIGNFVDFKDFRMMDAGENSTFDTRSIYESFAKWLEQFEPTVVFRVRLSDGCKISNLNFEPKLAEYRENKQSSDDLVSISMGIAQSNLKSRWLVFKGYRFSDQISLFIPIENPDKIDMVVARMNKSVGELTDFLGQVAESQDRIESILRVEELKRQESLVLAAQQVSHDIRSPLTALNLICGQLHSAPEEIRVLIRSATNRINDIANSLLESSKFGLIGDLSNNYEDASVLVGPLIDSVISEKRIQFREFKDLDIHLNLVSSYGLFANINQADLKRVISNLIDNSFEALPNHAGRIQVDVRSHEDSVEISVEDNGKGIPEFILKKLGNERVSYGKIGKQSGNGFGILHAKKTIDLLKGTLIVKSIEGFGSEFLIRVPRCRTPIWFLEKLELRRPKFLVSLDDDQSIHQIWKEKFGNLSKKLLGFKHVIFTSGDEFSCWVKNRKLEDGNSLIGYYFLIDYELLKQKASGLDLIEDLSINSSAILVTSRYEEKEVRFRCEKSHIKLVPKMMSDKLPINILN